MYVTDNTVSGDIFLQFVKQCLVPVLQPFNGSNARSVVIMDNASIHHVEKVVERIQQTGAIIRFLPPYSRGGGGGPAGPAKAGPLFSGSFVSSSDCRDGLRTTRKLALCLRFSLSFPLLCQRIRSPARSDLTESRYVQTSSW